MRTIKGNRYIYVLCKTHDVVKSPIWGFYVERIMSFEGFEFLTKDIVPTIYNFFFISTRKFLTRECNPLVLTVFCWWHTFETHTHTGIPKYMYIYILYIAMKYPTIDVSDSGQDFSDLECPAFRGITVFLYIKYIDFVKSVVSRVSHILRYTPATI